MATKLEEIRAKYPGAYDDVPDAELADRLYNKFYTDRDRREFDAAIGLNPYNNALEATGAALQNVPGRMQMAGAGLQQAAAEGVTDMLSPPGLNPGVAPVMGADGKPLPVIPADGGLGAGLRNVLTDKGESALAEVAATESLKAQLTYQQLQADQQPIDAAPGSPEGYVAGAIGSVAEMAPGLALSILMRSPAPAMAAIGLQVGGTTYAEGRAEGLPPELARQYAALNAAAEAIPEALPLGVLLEPGTKFLTRLVKGAIAEGVQESVTEALQIGIEMGYLNPDMTWGEAQERLKDAAIMGAIAGPLMGAVAHPAQKVVDVAYDAAEKGKAAIQQLFGAQPRTGEPKPAEPTMLDRVNQKLTERGFTPVNIPEPILPPTTPTEEAKPATTQVLDTVPQAPALPGAAAPAPEAPAPAATTPATTETPPASAADQIAMIESGGNPSAQNGASSAGGLGGFIDSTWINTVRQHAPELAGESNAQILARKKDASPEGVAFQRRMLEAHTNDNVAALQGAGIDPTPGNTYLAHFLGIGGAQEILAHGAGESVASIVSSKVMEANPFLRGMTVGDLQNWAANKMGGAGPLTIGAGRTGGLPLDAQTEADLIEQSRQQREAVDDGTGVLAPTIETAPSTAPPEPTTVSTPSAPVTVETPADIERVRQEVNTDPTPAQIEAGNYKKGHVRWQDYDITIETPKGGIRRGTNPDGTPWEVAMPADYGYIKRTTGTDGEQIDVYLGPDPESKRVFVVDQVDADTGAYDEHKVIMGVSSTDEARLLYKSAFSDGKGEARLGNIANISRATFDSWIKEGDHTKPFTSATTAKTKGKVKAPAKPKKPKDAAPDEELANDPRFEPARQAAKKFNGGQRVEFTDDNFDPPRVFTGTVKPKQFAGFKHMGVLEVAVDGARGGGTRDVSVDATNLRPEGQSSTPEPTKSADPLEGTKIVDDDGQPLVVHHFTYNSFEKFDRDYAAKQYGRSPDSIDTIGIWFTDNAKAAYVPTDGKIDLGVSRRVDAQIGMRKPFYLDDEPGRDAFSQLLAMVEKGGAAKLRTSMQANGYDGVVLQGTKLDGFEQTVIIPFEAEQIVPVDRKTFWPAYNRLAEWEANHATLLKRRDNKRAKLKALDADASPERRAAAERSVAQAETDVREHEQIMPSVIDPGEVVGEIMTVTTPTGQKIEVQPVIIAAEVLQKATGELQPRDRSRAASDAQIEDIAINLDPDRLLPSREADRGAPIIGPDNIVESGNGRRMALLRAAEAYPEKYLAYVKAVKAAGFEFKAMEGTPMLVMRRVTPMTDAERIEFVNAANTSAIARMSATEQAVADARLIDAKVLGAMEPGRGLNAMSLGAWDNKLAKAFLAKLPQAERAALADKDGQLNTDGVRRIQNALLAAAYGDAATVAKAAEDTDDNAKSITGALIDASADWIGMRRDIETAKVDPAYDMTDALVGALKLLDRARSQAAVKGSKVKDEINLAMGQVDIFAGEVDPLVGDFVEAFYSEGFARAKGRDKIAALLRAITSEVGSAIQPQLLGAAPTPQEVISGARRKTEREEERQGDIFAARAPGRGAGNGRDGDGNGTVQRAGAQDQLGAGQEAIEDGQQSGVGIVPASPAVDAVERAEPGQQDRSGAADDSQQVTRDDVHALGGDMPMPGYVPLYSRSGVPKRPASGVLTINGRKIDIPNIDAPQRREGFRTLLQDVIGSRLYFGKVKGQTRLGFYRQSNSEVRIAGYDDVEVMAHEMAHYLDYHYTRKGQFASRHLSRHLKDEVKQLSYTSDPKAVVSEGFAEFVRLWLTNYQAAKKAAPKFTAHFEAQLAKDPTLKTKMEKLQDAGHRWFYQGSHAQLRAKSGEEYTAGEEVIRFMQSYPAERFRQETLDKIHAAKVVERTLKGGIDDATRSAFKQFQMVNGAESVHDSIVNDGTVAVGADGTLIKSGIGLAKVFFPVAKHGWKRFDLLMDYFKARRASELMSQGRENLFTRSEIAAGLALAEKHPEFAEVFQAYQDFNQRMLDFYEQVGLITTDMRVQFAEANKNYVPFQRIGKQIAEGNRDGATSAIGKRLSGGTQNVADIAENIVEGLFANVRAALIARAKATLYRDIEKHQDGSLFAVRLGPDSKKITAHISQMARTVAGTMVELGIGVSKNGFIVNQGNVPAVIYDLDQIVDVLEKHPQLLDMWMMNQPPKTDGDTFVDMAIIDGEKRYYEVKEALLVEMLTGMRGLSSGAVLRALYGVKNLQTRTVTSWLQFLGPNAWRDTISAAVLSKNNFVPIVDTLIGMGHAALQTPLYKEMRRQGAGYGTRIEGRTEDTRARRRLDLPPRNLWDLSAKFLAGWDRFFSSFEYGSRAGDYRRGKIAGKNAMQAAWEAREITTDFSKIGRNEFWVKYMRTVPFMNAGLQGLDKTAQELVQIDGKMTVANLARFNRSKATFLLKGSVVTAMTLILWLLNSDDERYKALTDDERARYWWVWIPGLENPIKIPRPYDIGHIFASIPEAMLNYVKDKDGEAAANQLAWIAINTMPIGDYPGILQPWVEVATNKSFTGAPIVPNHMVDMPPQYQFSERTPQIYIRLGEAMGVSPMVAQHVAQGYGRYATQFIEDATEAYFWKSDEWGERPFVKGGPVDYLTYQFVGRRVPYRTKWTEGYYNLKSRAAGMRSALSNMTALAIKDGEPLDQLARDRYSMTLVALDNVFNQIDSAFEDQDAFLASVKYNPDLTAAALSGSHAGGLLERHLGAGLYPDQQHAGRGRGGASLTTLHVLVALVNHGFETSGDGAEILAFAAQQPLDDGRHELVEEVAERGLVHALEGDGLRHCHRLAGVRDGHADPAGGELGPIKERLLIAFPHAGVGQHLEDGEHEPMVARIAWHVDVNHDALADRPGGQDQLAVLVHRDKAGRPAYALTAEDGFRHR